MRIYKIVSAFVMAFCAILSAKADIGGFEIAGTRVPHGTAYAVYQLDLGQLAGRTLSEAQFVIPERTEEGWLAIWQLGTPNIFADLPPDWQVYNEYLQPWQILEETLPNGSSTGNWLVEFDTGFADYYRPGYYDRKDLTFLDYTNESLGLPVPQDWYFSVRIPQGMYDAFEGSQATFRGNFAAVPEPSSFALIGGLLVFGPAALRRRKRI